ncbi:hypothetical protein PF008_g33245, partial [Phytophthora fragariae]
MQLPGQVRRWSPGVVRGSVVQEGVVREEGMEDVRLDKVREDVQINKVRVQSGQTAYLRSGLLL